MLPREDFIFTIGYNGPIAVIDKQARKKYGKLSTKELAEKGLFRAAYSSALYSGNADECKFVGDYFKTLGGNPTARDSADKSADKSVDKSADKSENLSDAELSALSRLFGVLLVDVKRTMIL